MDIISKKKEIEHEDVKDQSDIRDIIDNFLINCEDEEDALNVASEIYKVTQDIEDVYVVGGEYDLEISITHNHDSFEQGVGEEYPFFLYISDDEYKESVGIGLSVEQMIQLRENINKSLSRVGEI